MPPKESKAGGLEYTIAGFEPRETKLLAAAFVSSIGPDKVMSGPCIMFTDSLTRTQYDFDLFASLTGNTAGSLKKMFPPVKRKAADAHPSFAAYLGLPPTANAGTEAKAPAPKKQRKVAPGAGDAGGAPKETETEVETKEKVTQKKGARGRPKKVTDAAEEPEAGEDDTRKKAPAKGPGRPGKAKSADNGKDVKKEPSPDGNSGS